MSEDGQNVWVFTVKMSGCSRSNGCSVLFDDERAVPLPVSVKMEVSFARLGYANSMWSLICPAGAPAGSRLG